MNALPHPTELEQKRTVRIIAAGCVVALVASVWLLDVELIDDSYIFLVYARNLAEGHGPVFNIGERTEGFSSPFWTLLLGAGGLITTNLETLAWALGIVCGAGVVILLVGAAWRFDACRGRVVESRADLTVFGLGLATGPALVFWSGSGMEAPLFVLLITASLLSILADRRGRALSLRSALLLALLTIVRPEGILLAVYVLVFFLIERRSVRTLVFYAALVGAMLAGRYAYYGAWLPNTYYAKVTFEMARRLSDATVYTLPGLKTNALLLIATVGAVLFALQQRRAHGLPLMFLTGWIALWSAYVFYVGGDNFPFYRFWLPVLPALFLLLWGSWLSVRPLLSLRLRSACLSALGAAFVVSHVWTFHSASPAYYANVKFAAAWAEVGRWLHKNTPPETVVATVTPGAMTYFSRRTTIDMLGLTDRTISVEGLVYAKGGHGHARYHTDYIFQRDPDLIVYHSSGRYKKPVYDVVSKIGKEAGYALYDFVSDPRCRQRYVYTTELLASGKILEMQRRLESDRVALTTD